VYGLTVRFTETDDAAYESFFDALDAVKAERGDEFETYFHRGGDTVDGNASEVINALLAAGWRPPA
jgi:hypothetical protein